MHGQGLRKLQAQLRVGVGDRSVQKANKGPHFINRHKNYKIYPVSDPKSAIHRLIRLFSTVLPET